jgi:hypothetical protein
MQFWNLYISKLNFNNKESVMTKLRQLRKELFEDVKTINGLTISAVPYCTSIVRPRKKYVVIEETVEYSGHFGWSETTVDMYQSDEKERFYSDHEGTRIDVKSFTFEQLARHEIESEINKRLNLKHLHFSFVEIDFISASKICKDFNIQISSLFNILDNEIYQEIDGNIIAEIRAEIERIVDETYPTKGV